MKVDQIQQGLEQAFVTENHRIVFWYDADQSFTETLATLSLTDVTVLNMSEESVLATKLHLEMTDTQGKYLLYFPYAEQSPPKIGYWISNCIHAVFMQIVSPSYSMNWS